MNIFPYQDKLHMSLAFGSDALVGDVIVRNRDKELWRSLRGREHGVLQLTATESIDKSFDQSN